MNGKPNQADWRHIVHQFATDTRHPLEAIDAYFDALKYNLDNFLLPAYEQARKAKLPIKDIQPERIRQLRHLLNTNHELLREVQTQMRQVRKASKPQ